MRFSREVDINGDCVNGCLCSTCMDERISTRTPSGAAKNAGLKSLNEVSQISGVSLQTLSNWHKNKPALFEVVIAGCVVKRATGARP